ncbi:hypothetical protein BC829DRAFT_354641, partial [Chytridium lagenaria]
NPIRMIVLGPGGTGKSHLVNALSDFHKRLGVETALERAAFTGVAAANIHGETIH